MSPFFFEESKTPNARRSRPKTDPKISDETLHELGCKACPLNDMKCYNPKMEPSGSSNPLIYILGEAPGEAEDKKGEPFVGPSGQLLRDKFNSRFHKRVRYNNCVQTRPPKNRNPIHQEIECCRPRVIEDVSKTRPKVIIGTGNVPLSWMLKKSGISQWRGRLIPVLVGTYRAWFFPIIHPAAVLRDQSGRQSSRPSGFEESFNNDLKWIQEVLEDGDLAPPEPEDMDHLEDGLELLYDADEVVGMLDQIGKELDVVGIDLETTMLRPYSPEAQILSVAIGDGDTTIAFPLNHPSHKWTSTQETRIHASLREFLLAPVTKVAHNLAFEQEWLSAFFGCEILRSSTWSDTMVQGYCLDERHSSKFGGFSLDDLVMQHFGFSLKSQSPVDRAKCGEAPLDQLLRYNALDTKYTYKLWEKQAPLIEEQKLRRVYKEQMRRIPTIVLTQRAGLDVDFELATKLSKDLELSMEEVNRSIAELECVSDFEAETGEEFNPASNEHIAKILYEILGFEAMRTEKGNYRTSEDVISQIDHKLVALVMQRRGIAKQKGTYVDTCLPDDPKTIIHGDGKIHTSFNTVFTETGRLSANSPNMQNWPKREHKEVRDLIRAPEGHVLLAIDYGQIEARVIAMFSKDKTLVKALFDDYDIHMEWAERFLDSYPGVFRGLEGKTQMDKLKALRQKVKNGFVFPAFYGSSTHGISEGMEVPMPVVSSIFEEFWKMFAGVRKWQKNLKEFYRINGYVECLTGRRRRAPLSHHQMINAPIQGTASDIVIDAMNRLSELAEEGGDHCLQPVLNVHDDLTFVVEEERLEDLTMRIIDTMLDVPYSFVNVPITLEASVGKSWGDMADVGEFDSRELED